MTTEENKEKLKLHVFTNDKSKENLQFCEGLLKVVYHSAFTGKLGLMQSKNSETGEVDNIIVAVTEDENGVNCYPLFAPIKAEDVGKYQAPDGKGEYLSNV